MKEKSQGSKHYSIKVKLNHVGSKHNWIQTYIMHQGQFICKRMQSMANEAYKSQQQRLHSKVNSNIFKNHEINHTQS
jgi:hypothetical protein